MLCPALSDHYTCGKVWKVLRSENLYTAHRHLDVGACCTYAETTGVGHGDPQTEAYRTVSIRKWDFWNLATVVLRAKGT